MTQKQIIVESLRSVGHRTRMQRLFDSLSTGLLIGTIHSIPFIILHWFGFGLLPLTSWGLLAVFCVGGLAFGAIVWALSRVRDRESARKIDSSYNFKDRLLTSVRLLWSKNPTMMERLQLEDAALHAQKVDARIVAPYRIPKNLYRAMTLLVVAVGLCLISPYFDQTKTLEAAQPVEEVVAVIEQIKEELLEELEQLARENPEEEQLETLSEEMKELLEQLQQQETDPREALSTLSQMEAALNQAISEFNLEAMDESLMELAETLSAAESTRSASQALKQGEYAKAADELEKADAESLSKQERKALADQLKKNAGFMMSRNQAKFAKLAEKLADEMSESDCQGAKESMCEIAGVCKNQGLRKGICQGLGNKLAMLSLCKSDCAGACQSKKDGGNSNKKSKNPSTNWGKGTAGDPASGEETQMDSNRDLKQITGMKGAGPSEFETIKSSEGGEEVTSRSYQEAYRDYRKMSESVLETEPIPLGQRKMIRQYFESIRPQGEENTPSP